MTKIDPKQWFDVKDSKTKDGEAGEAYYNVEARFADHPILDVSASRIARHNVYFLGIVLHTRVKRTAHGGPAIKNSTSVVFRFDKGMDETTTVQAIGPEGTTVASRVGKAGLSKEDFDSYIKWIVRCKEAWEHYQKFRKSPVTDLEKEATKAIERLPANGNASRVIVDAKGNPLMVDGIEEEETDDLDFIPEEGSTVVIHEQPKSRKKK